MTIWAFIVILCCPFSYAVPDPVTGLTRAVPHEITWKAPTEQACRSQRKALVEVMKGYTVNATVGECLKLVEVVKP